MMIRESPASSRAKLAADRRLPSAIDAIHAIARSCSKCGIYRISCGQVPFFSGKSEDKMDTLLPNEQTHLVCSLAATTTSSGTQ